MEGLRKKPRRKPRRDTSHKEIWGTAVREGRGKGNASAKKEGDEDEHLDIYGELTEDIGVETYLHGPIDYAKMLKLLRVGDLDQPQRRKKYISSRVEEEDGTQGFPCSNADDRNHMVGECEI